MKKYGKFLFSFVIILLFFIGLGSNFRPNLTAATKLNKIGSSSGSFVWKNAIEKSGIDFWRASYTYFDGWKKRSFTFSKDDKNKCIIQANVETHSGELDIVVYDKNNDELYNYTNIKTSTFDIILDTDGEYEVKVIGKSHNGNFSIKPKVS